MAKVTLTRISSMVNAPTTINGILTEIESAFDNTLSRDGDAPNVMTASLDMNSQRILNLPAPVASTEPVRMADIDLDVLNAEVAAAAASAAAAHTSELNVAANATTIATNAANAAVATSTAAAATSATNAATSATNAATSATSAATSAANVRGAGVKTRTLSAPPGGPATGDRYIVGPSPTGAWAGKANNIATWDGAAWTFIAPPPSAIVIVEDEFAIYAYNVGTSKWEVVTSSPLAFSTYANLVAVTGAAANIKANVLADTKTATISRARNTNVATIVLSGLFTPALAIGQTVNISSLGGTGYNGYYVLTNVTNDGVNTTITYANTGSNEGTTADTAGRLDRNGVYRSDGAGAWQWLSYADFDSLVASKADIASPTFTGVPAAPTAALGTNTTQIATTQFVTNSDGGRIAPTMEQTVYWGKSSPTTGSPLSTGTYVFCKTVPARTDIVKIEFYARAAGTLKIKRMSAAGVEIENRTFTISSSGLKTYDLIDIGARLTLEVGERLGFYSDCAYLTVAAPIAVESFFYNGGATDSANVNVAGTVPTSNSNVQLYVTGKAYAQDKNEIFAFPVFHSLVEPGHVYKETLGSQANPVPDGTGPAGSGHYTFVDPARHNGYIYSVNYFLSADGPIYLSLWTRSGDTLTRIGQYQIQGTSGAHTWTPEVPIEFSRGTYFSLKSTVMRVTTGTKNHGRGAWSVAGDTSPATVPATTISTEISGGIVLAYESSRGDFNEYVVSIPNSDKIAIFGNSYSAGAYNLSSKSYTQRLSALSDHRFENFSYTGDSFALLLNRLRNYTTTFYLQVNDGNPFTTSLGGMSAADYGSTYALLIINQNTANMTNWLNDLHDVIEQMKGIGLIPILSTEHVEATFSGLATAATLKQVAEERGCYFFDLIGNGRTFRNAPYSLSFERTVHPGQRKSDLFAAPLLAEIKRQLPRPQQNLKIFRRRSTWTVATIDDLAFDLSSDKHWDRGRKWQEISLGSGASLDGAAQEAYMDSLDQTASYTLTSQKYSEYLPAQLGRPISFTDYGLLSFTINAIPKNVQEVTLEVNDPSLTVYVRHTFSGTYPAAGSTAGKWIQKTVDANGEVHLSGYDLIGALSDDQIHFMVYNGGAAFNLVKPRLRWRGMPGKPERLKLPSSNPRGSTLITTPYMVSADALVAGWSSTGSPTFGRGITRSTAQTASDLPYGAAGHINLSSADSISWTSTFAADPINSREAEIEIWAHAVRALVDPTAYQADPTTSSINTNTWDFEQLKVTLTIGGVGAITYRTIGLWWWKEKIRCIIPATATSVTLTISSGSTGTVGVAYAQIRLVD